MSMSVLSMKLQVILMLRHFSSVIREVKKMAYLIKSSVNHSYSKLCGYAESFFGGVDAKSVLAVAAFGTREGVTSEKKSPKTL